MGDEDGEKRAEFFKDKKKKRERQLKERKKRLDGSDSEGKEDSEDGREKTQLGAYDSLTPLRSTSRLPSLKQKEHLKLNKLKENLTKLNLTTQTHHHNIKKTSRKQIQTNRKRTLKKTGQEDC
jgi:hypothetical protein